MPFHEGKFSGPFTVPKDEVGKYFRPLSKEEKEKLKGDKEGKKEGQRKEKTTLTQAERILGRENYFGPEAVETAFGTKLKPEDIPLIPFSSEELERAKELGQFLILRVNTTADGEPLTMLKMHESLTPVFSTSGSGKVLYSIGEEWKKNSDFFMKEIPQCAWALVSKEPIENSKNKNYLEQTQLLARYITEKVFKTQDIPTEYAQAIAEFQEYYDRNFKRKTKEEIRGMLNENNWKKYAKELSELRINELLRQSPVDVLYDMLVYYQSTGGRFLENDYTWTNRRSSDGDLVGVGSFAANGAGVSGWRPGDAVAFLGVSFSRSL